MKANRRFNPPEEVPADVAALAEEQPAVLTVNGKPIPPEFAHVIAYDATDQGIAEKAARRTHEPSGVQMVSDAWDKGLERRANSEPWDDFDVLRESLAPVKQPGFAYRYISPRVADKRGMRGWEKVLDAEGHDVKVGNLFLARMPETAKQRRNKHYADIGNEAVATAAQQYALDQEKLVKDSGMSGLAPLSVGDLVRDRMNPDFAASIGVETQRGGGVKG